MKTALFLDTSDLYHRVRRKYQKKLDYSKILSLYSEDLVTAIAYGVLHESASFITCLKKAGYITKFQTHEPGVELAVDVLSRLDKLECVVLGTGSQIYVPLARYISERGVRCVLCTCGAVAELKQYCDHVREIEEDETL